MQKLTVYGLPLNPMPKLAELASPTASFCVSYATRDKLGKQLDQAIELVGQDGILLVDNGAFSAHQNGVDTMTDETYLEGFADWANDILDRCPQAVAVIPDVIGGTEQQNAQLVCETMTMFDCERIMPVWHMHESFDYLIYLCESFGYVAFGSSGEYWKIGTPAWHARIEAAFAAIARWEELGNVRPRIHMMRAQSMAHRYDFDSSDSTNVAVNHGRQRRLGEELAAFAGRVDRKIQSSAGAEAYHQLQRPLLDHIEGSNQRAVWLLEAAGYAVSDEADQWLDRYHLAA